MLTYHKLDASPDDAWLALFNSAVVRKHLLQHPRFTDETIRVWIQDKLSQDLQPGCRIRAVHHDGKLAGWCGIQLECGIYELAIVLAPAYWGYGREVMKQVISWAQELGHRELFAHLPSTRPQTKALAKLLGPPVGVTSIQDHVFNTYRIEIGSRSEHCK